MTGRQASYSDDERERERLRKALADHAEYYSLSAQQARIMRSALMLAESALNAF